MTLLIPAVWAATSALTSPILPLMLSMRPLVTPVVAPMSPLANGAIWLLSRLLTCCSSALMPSIAAGPPIST